MAPPFIRSTFFIFPGFDFLFFVFYIILVFFIFLFVLFFTQFFMIIIGGDAGGIIFINFGANYKKSIFYKNCILDISHHLRGATEFSWGQ